MPIPLIRIIDTDNAALWDEYSALGMRVVQLSADGEVPAKVLQALKAWHMSGLHWFSALDAGLVHLFADGRASLHPLVRKDRLDNCIGWLGIISKHFDAMYDAADDLRPAVEWEPQLPGFGSYATIQRYLSMHRPEYAAIHLKIFREMNLPTLGFAAIEKRKGGAS